MESSNFHQHQLQEQFLDHQTLYGSTSVSHGSNNSSSSSAWNPNQLILNGEGNIDHILVPPSLNTTSMFQDLGFHCANTSSTTSFTNTQSAAHELHLAKIKKELSSHHPFKNQEQQFHYIKQQHHHDHEQVLLQQDLSDHEQQKLLLKSYSSNDLYSNNHTFSSQIFPSTNISNLLINNPSSSSTLFSSSLRMNFQALDLLSSGSFGSSSSQPTSQNNNLGLSNFDLDHLQGISSSSSTSTTLWPSNNNKMSSLFMNGGGGARGTETKRSSNALEEYSSSTSSKGTPPHHTVVVPKKPRMESRSSSFPPFKVRKEKLGDRIATLQQLVAPFGKTDTASVLMEAIGYIKFLQDQVETLSVPYMKSVRNHSRVIVPRSQGSSSTEDIQEGNKEAKQQRDLRSRGLCLVPLTFTSYISGVDNISIGTVWPPLPNYGGGGT